MSIIEELRVSVRSGGAALNVVAMLMREQQSPCAACGATARPLILIDDGGIVSLICAGHRNGESFDAADGEVRIPLSALGGTPVDERAVARLRDDIEKNQESKKRRHER